MNVRTLLKLNPVDNLRFYEESDELDPLLIDEYTLYKTEDNVDLDREVSYFCSTIVKSCTEEVTYWISVILKDYNKYN